MQDNGVHPPASLPPARVLIADDHVFVREGTRAMLEDEPDIVITAEAENGRQAVELCKKLCPDLVLMDVRMPEMDGLQATKALKEECPQTSVLIMTSHENPDYLLEAIKAGAAGYVLKEATKSEVLSAVRAVLTGESALNQGLAMQLLKRLSGEVVGRGMHTKDQGSSPPPPTPETLAKTLTQRELEVLRLIVEGKTNREISEELVISLSTVKRHVERIMPKLKVSDRTQAAVKAVELGLHANQVEGY